jgi:hypothetical protein
MKTIQKTMALSIAIFFASVSYGQLGIGLASSTQTAINATANAASVVTAAQSISSATLAATRGTMNVVAAKAIDIKATTVTTVDASGKAAVGTIQAVKTDVKNDVKSSTDASVKADASVAADGKVSTASGANVKAEGSVVVSKQ